MTGPHAASLLTSHVTHGDRQLQLPQVSPPTVSPATGTAKPPGSPRGHTEFPCGAARVVVTDTVCVLAHALCLSSVLGIRSLNTLQGPPLYTEGEAEAQRGESFAQSHTADGRVSPTSGRPSLQSVRARPSRRHPSAAPPPGLPLILNVNQEARRGSPGLHSPSLPAIHKSGPWMAGSYLLSSMDVALLTFSKSSTESISRTCFCCAASSRRLSWTTLDKLGEASFWKAAHNAPC